MEWVLYVCTAGRVMCGQIREVVYPSEATCYRALDELYRRNKPDAFKYVVCQPKALNKTANTEAKPTREAGSA